MKLLVSISLVAIFANPGLGQVGLYDHAFCDHYPDPHIRTWDNEYYDFHGAADLIACAGDVIDVHVKTVPFSGWSGIDAVAIHIHADNTTLEVKMNTTGECCDYQACLNCQTDTGVDIGVLDNPDCCPAFCCDDRPQGGTTRSAVGGTSTYYIDGVTPATPPATIGSYGFEVTASGYKLLPGGAQYIQIDDYGNTLRLLMYLHGSVGYTCDGTCGNWKDGGVRDRNGTVLVGGTRRLAAGENGIVNEEVGQAWYVQDDDPKYFLEPNEDPPEHIPGALNPELEAEAAEECKNVENDKAKENCIFDIMLTGDFDWATTPRYMDPEPDVSREPDECSGTGFLCRLLRGTCVYRCDRGENICLPRLCGESDAAAARKGDSLFGLRDGIVEGCSCIPFSRRRFG